MKLTIYQVDAFVDKVFQGNPAAGCPLTEWLADDILLKIAAENNLAGTAFYVPKENSFEIRWFTPNTEVDLCGHATLATAICGTTLRKLSAGHHQFLFPTKWQTACNRSAGQICIEL